MPVRRKTGTKKAQEIIVRRAISYAKANTALSYERTVNMPESVFGIIRDFYRLQCKNNKELLFVAAQIEDTIDSF